MGYKYVKVRGHTRRIKTKGCFIATACYGKDSEQVRVLRYWRDNNLLKNSFGKGFVNFYYNNSPPIADFIRDKPFLKGIVRGGISPLTKLITFLK
ncbi:hypothetical protein KAI04_03510 [Candidatus Pacearchaeota archaeon]|nr:hypothetical protein [Candidatus Pacearchaeota archaeon]